MTEKLYVLEVSGSERLLLMAALGRLRQAVAAGEGGPNTNNPESPCNDRKLYELGQVLIDAEEWTEEDDKALAEVEDQLESGLAFTKRETAIVAASLGLVTGEFMRTGKYPFNIDPQGLLKDVTLDDVLPIIKKLADSE